MGVPPVTSPDGSRRDLLREPQRHQFTISCGGPSVQVLPRWLVSLRTRQPRMVRTLIFLTPRLTEWLAGTYVPVDAWALLLDTVRVVLVPVMAGLALHHLFPRMVKVILPILITVSLSWPTRHLCQRGGAGVISIPACPARPPCYLHRLL